MKNLKLTLATTLSVLALTFAGTASADGGKDQKRYNKQKQQSVIVKSKTKQNVNRHVAKQVNNKRVVKKVVRHTPTRKVVTTKRYVQKPAKRNNRFVTNKRYNQVKQHNKRYKQNRNHRNNRFNVRDLHNQFVYSVRSGGATFQFSF